MTTGKNDTIKQCREYTTNLFKRRSIIALCAGLLTIMLSFYGIIAGVNKTVAVMGKNAFTSFYFFTMISNTLAALSATFTVPYAVEGIRKKRFTLPGWISVMHYSATVSVTIVMLFTVFVMSWISPEDAFGDFNIVLHVFCPILILVSFFQTENEHIYSVKDQLLGVAPFFIYAIVYYIEAILIGEGNGGWQDIYGVKGFPRYRLSSALLLLSAVGISYLIRMLSNRLTNIRNKKMFSFWREDADPIEVRIEAYGLGVMIGLHGEKNNIQVPYDILEYLAEKYQLNVDNLTKPFMTGVLNGIKERK